MERRPKKCQIQILDAAFETANLTIKTIAVT